MLKSRTVVLNGFFLFLFSCISAAAVAGFDLSAASVTGALGSSVSVPIVGDFNKPVNSIQFSLKFNPDLLTVAGISAGASAPSWTVVNNPKMPGTVVVGMFNTGGKNSALQGPKKEIAVIKFNVNKSPKAPADNAELVLSKASFDTDAVTELTAGMFKKK